MPHGLYNKALQTTVDRHAPLYERIVTVRHHMPFYNDEIKAAKKDWRRAETVWKNNKTDQNHPLFQQAQNKVSALVDEAKQVFYCKVADENKHCPKGLFKVINTLTNNKKENPLPPHEDPESLANEFAEFFANKILKIRHEISQLDLHRDTPLAEEKCIPHLSQALQTHLRKR